jgi:hypothetical protein
VHAPLSEVLVCYGIDAAELAAELESVAPYSDPTVGPRMAGQIRLLSAHDLAALEDFVGYLKYHSQQQARGKRRLQGDHRADPAGDVS